MRLTLGPARMRRAVPAALVLAGLGVPGAAHAEVRPLARAEADAQVALAGSDVLLGSGERRRLSVRSVSIRTGRVAERYALRLRRRRAGVIEDLDASPSRTAFIQLVRRRGRSPTSLTVLAGSPLGPFRPISSQPDGVEVDGDVLAIFESRKNRVRNRVLLPGAAPVDVPLPSDASDHRLAGSFIAYVAAPSQRETPPTIRDRIVVFDWQARSVRYHVDIPAPVANYDLTPGGDLIAVAELERGTALYTASPAAPRARLVPRSDGYRDPHFAGGLVAARARGGVLPRQHVALLDPATGAARRLSPNSAELGEIDAEGATVTWVANGCVFAASVADPGVTRVPAGPCPRAELYLGDPGEVRLRRRRLLVRMRCVNSDARACRGSMALRLDDRPGKPMIGRARYRVRRGKRAFVPVRLSRRARRRLRQDPRGPAVAPLRVVARTIDRAGRGSRTETVLLLAAPR